MASKRKTNVSTPVASAIQAAAIMQPSRDEKLASFVTGFIKTYKAQNPTSQYKGAHTVYAKIKLDGLGSINLNDGLTMLFKLPVSLRLVKGEGSARQVTEIATGTREEMQALKASHPGATLYNSGAIAEIKKLTDRGVIVNSRSTVYLPEDAKNIGSSDSANLAEKAGALAKKLGVEIFVQA